MPKIIWLSSQRKKIAVSGSPGVSCGDGAERGTKHREGQGILYVVAMPIGNPGDITVRALEVLREADAIACEDTRRTGAMLAAHQIRKPLISHFEHNEERRVPELIERMVAGERIALVTDAGTPAISDPGYRLVRAAHEAGIRVTAVPGASAAIAALSISGIATNRFTFEGFLPSRDSARRKALEALRTESRTMIFYEAARRLGDDARRDGAKCSASSAAPWSCAKSPRPTKR